MQKAAAEEDGARTRATSGPRHANQSYCEI